MRILFVLLCILAMTAICSAQNVLYFPQTADGIQSDGISWGMMIAITNPAAPGTPAANGTLITRRDNGMEGPPPGGRGWIVYGHITPPFLGGTEIPFQLAGGQTIVFISPCESGQNQFCQSQSTAPYPVYTGSATVTSDLPLVGTLIFSEFGPAGRIAQAGISSATPSTKQEILAIAPNSSPGTLYPPNTATSALAVANPGTVTANITFQLLDANGVASAPPATKTLAPNNHTAFFVTELVPGATIAGTMRIVSDVPIVATALLFQSNGEFATFPVFPLP